MSYSSSSGAVVKLAVLCLVFTKWAPLIVGDDDKTPSDSLLKKQVIASHCSDKCGDIPVRYPFGIEEGCYYKDKRNQVNYTSTFKISCNESSIPIFGTNLEVLNITIGEGEIRIKNWVAHKCYNQTGLITRSNMIYIDFVSFTLSSTKNVLVAVGCNSYAWFDGRRIDGRNFSTGCMTTCSDKNEVVDGECSGIGCCQITFPSSSRYIHINVKSWNNQNKNWVYGFNPCSVGFPVEKNAFRFHQRYLSQGVDAMTLPVVGEWAIGPNNCSQAKADQNCLCNDNAECHDSHNGLGYRCKCKPGFEGNAYLPHGCTDINECERANKCQNKGFCINTEGSYVCRCPKGYHGNGTTSDHCVPNTKPWLIPVLATAGIGVGIISVLVIAFLFYWKQEERQLRKTRDKFFRQNGGLLLNEKLSGRSKLDVLKIFTSKDVENACNNYSNDNIIGRGGFGVVYKGILPNKQIVAIKKSLKVDPDQVEQFINEVLILSQIKNRYVVKLLGCCLESEVPLLVYEFINNGTLYDHLHNDVKAAILTWPIRLNIASQVASVLAYLHDVADTQIIHRDMKSMNILLDETYTAKVTDFGASRQTSSDETELATLVIGTRGYLDPEYLQSGKLTDKSDVYSFGVVLVELLTREEAVSFKRPQIERYLANHFLAKIRDGCLLNILDNNIVSEATVEQVQHVANLAKWCLNLQGDRRPTMKEAALELETIKRKGCHPWNNANDGSLEQDSEYLLADYPTSLDDFGASTSGIESNVVYDSQLLSTLESGR